MGTTIQLGWSYEDGESLGQDGEREGTKGG